MSLGKEVAVSSLPLLLHSALLFPSLTKTDVLIRTDCNYASLTLDDSVRNALALCISIDLFNYSQKSGTATVEKSEITKWKLKS